MGWDCPAVLLTVLTSAVASSPRGSVALSALPAQSALLGHTGSGCCPFQQGVGALAAKWVAYPQDLAKSPSTQTSKEGQSKHTWISCGIDQATVHPSVPRSHHERQERLPASSTLVQGPGSRHLTPGVELSVLPQRERASVTLPASGQAPWVSQLSTLPGRTRKRRCDPAQLQARHSGLPASFLGMAVALRTFSPLHRGFWVGSNSNSG